jgi:Fe-S cluster assembly protein SufD
MSLVQAIDRPDLPLLPSRRDEDWRWTDLRGLVREPLGTSGPAPVVQTGGPFADLDAYEIVIANGQLNWWPEDEDSTAGLSLNVHDQPGAPLMGEAMPMALLAAAKTAEPRAVILRADGEAPRLAMIRFVSAAAGTAHHARFGVVVGAGSKLTLMESHEGRGDGYFANALVEIFLEPGAQLERIVIMDEAEQAISIASAEIHLLAGAAFAQTVVSSGAKRERIETRLTHPGCQAAARLDGLYLVSGGRRTDITTVVTHDGAGGSTDQLVKGVVDDQGRAVFQGRIVVSPGADQTDAKMGHHALILSDRAEVDAKPELEIYADDVACAHGNTVGALDAEALFYAEQRGIPPAEARALLTLAFVGQVVDRIGHEGARDVVRRWVAARLRAPDADADSGEPAP